MNRVLRLQSLWYTSRNNFKAWMVDVGVDEAVMNHFLARTGQYPDRKLIIGAEELQDETSEVLSGEATAITQQAFEVFRSLTLDGFRHSR